LRTCVRGQRWREKKVKWKKVCLTPREMDDDLMIL